MIKIIDPHLHLFDITQGDYYWLKPENPPFWADKPIIHRSFTCANIELQPPFSLCGFVHIEAGFDNQQPIKEVEYLQQTVTLPFTAIAYANITDEPVVFKQTITALMQNRHVVGIRYILDDNAIEILSNTNVKENFLWLAENSLIFDCQMPLANKKAVSLLCTLLSQTPTLKVVINHLGSPSQIDEKVINNKWYQGLLALSAFPSVAIKCSGWEMVSRSYDHQWLRTMVLTCVDVFGEHRVMLASNFPLCLFTVNYQEYWQQVIDVIPNSLIPNLCYKNAKKWYNVE
ncbi:amidohydrolase family protein [Thalassotalea sp. 1_MG-2023]|uniref:amidohydrolase family protein n=1 Tax=Thalassotalea sp. 1_MG-2023 TaxID=3062680 RepID=UPI0026E3D690|nr:amidohydrolase family protein [Thalassotalea sp. 1_MG-2023]MDO6427540.1 amidohydrolase family protein [Thalassotalea sp. 1_MG-2023]